MTQVGADKSGPVFSYEFSYHENTPDATYRWSIDIISKRLCGGPFKVNDIDKRIERATSIAPIGGIDIRSTYYKDRIYVTCLQTSSSVPAGKA